MIKILPEIAQVTSLVTQSYSQWLDVQVETSDEWYAWGVDTGVGAV